MERDGKVVLNRNFLCHVTSIRKEKDQVKEETDAGGKRKENTSKVNGAEKG